MICRPSGSTLADGSRQTDPSTVTAPDRMQRWASLRLQDPWDATNLSRRCTMSVTSVPSIAYFVSNDKSFPSGKSHRPNQAPSEEV